MGPVPQQPRVRQGLSNILYGDRWIYISRAQIQFWVFNVSAHIYRGRENSLSAVIFRKREFFLSAVFYSGYIKISD